MIYLTREYPPHIYGGAGVHVEYLSRHMAQLASVEVKCFGDQHAPSSNPSVQGHPFVPGVFGGNPHRAAQALMVLQTCMDFNGAPLEGDVVHTHTWYAAWGGILAKLAYGLPLVVTVHSLEPLRPWKREQLGRGYEVSSWVEKCALEMADAVIAVSGDDLGEILSRFQVDRHKAWVIPNGIDVEHYRPAERRGFLDSCGIRRDRPYVLFLGRISRQKGIGHFLRAAQQLEPHVQVVMCAGSPETPELAGEVERAWNQLVRERPHSVWIREMIPRDAAIELYSHASVFCCPSVYEPFGIINLEAMACETPVVASNVGGIKDVVIHGETGYLVPFERRSSEDPEPANTEAFAHDLAQAMNRLLADAELSTIMGQRGRARVIENFGWDRVAGRVMEVYEHVTGAGTASAHADEQDLDPLRVAAKRRSLRGR